MAGQTLRETDGFHKQFVPSEGSGSRSKAGKGSRHSQREPWTFQWKMAPPTYQQRNRNISKDRVKFHDFLGLGVLETSRNLCIAMICVELI